MTSTRSRRSDSSQALTMCSGRPSGAGTRPGVRSRATSPPLVASTTVSRSDGESSASASPTSSSLWKGPYTSAVSISVTPWATADRITSIERSSTRSPGE